MNTTPIPLLLLQCWPNYLATPIPRQSSLLTLPSHLAVQTSMPRGTGEGRGTGPFEGARAGQSNSTPRIIHKNFKTPMGAPSTSSTIIVVLLRSFDGQLCACALYKGRSSSGGTGRANGSKPSAARAGGQSHKPAPIGDWLYQGAAAVVI